MNKKAFTLIEIIAVIVILGILLIVATVSVSSYLKSGREKSFKVLVENFEDAAKSAYTDCLLDSNANDFCRTHDLPALGGEGTIKLSELVVNGYIEELKNPWNKKEKCDQQTSEIKVKRVADSKGSIEFEYKVCLRCGNRASDGCNE